MIRIYHTVKGTEYEVELDSYPERKRHRYWWGIYERGYTSPLAAGFTRFRPSAVCKIAKTLFTLEWEETRNDRKKECKK